MSGTFTTSFFLLMGCGMATMPLNSPSDLYLSVCFILPVLRDCIVRNFFGTLTPVSRGYM